jgi:hypothetical protein
VKTEITEQPPVQQQSSLGGQESGSRQGSRRWWEIWKRPAPDDSAYRRLALQIHHGLPRQEGAPRSVLIVTPKEARWCARRSLTLASCMAEELKRPVLLIDASDDGETSRILHAQGTAGLTDFLADSMQQLTELALPTSQQSLHFLSRGRSTGRFNASPDVARDLLVRATRHWDFVVVAGGPVLKSAFSLAVAPYAGRVLLLVTENRTHIGDIDRAQHTLVQCGVQNVSMVVSQKG